jgi:DnaJ domain
VVAEKSSAMMSAYDVLGVRAAADAAIVKAAFLQAVKKCHPDLNPGYSDAEERFRQLLSARAEIKQARQRIRAGRRKSLEIFIAIGTLVAASSASLALFVSIGQVPAIAFETRTVQIGEWSTTVQDQSEIQGPAE